MNHYSRVANTASFVVTSFLALASIFNRHTEMPILFKVLIVAMVFTSAYLLRYTLVCLYDNGCQSMMYTFVFHTALFLLTVIGAKIGAYK